MEPARAPREDGGAEELLGELEGLVKGVVRASSWWERRGVDCSILALSLLAVPAGEGRGDRNAGNGLRVRAAGGGGRRRGRAAGRRGAGLGGWGGPCSGPQDRGVQLQPESPVRGVRPLCPEELGAGGGSLKA